MEKNIHITIASEQHLSYVSDIEKALRDASEKQGLAIAARSSQYLEEKIREGKSIIAFSEEGIWAGYCYIESWGHSKFVANSGLIVAEIFRGCGLASEIKKRAMQLSARLFPGAKLFGLTTSLAVMKINSDLGYRPVTFSRLTDDEQFWKGCETCPYYDILVRTKRNDCLCTAMILDPQEIRKVNGHASSEMKVKITHI